MKKINVLVGIPGSGKDYYLENKPEDNGYILSSDAIRKELFGDESCQDNNGLVFDTLYKRLINLVKESDYKTIWINATNINRKSRRVLFERLKQAKVRDQVRVEALVMATPLDICIKHDASRERSVGEDVILKFVHRFEFPQKFEGFERVGAWYYVGDFTGNVKRDLDKMKGFDQKNPWHSMDMWGHTQAVVDGVPERMKLAAYCHDIGKLFTQTIGEDGVAHYYRHENVSAYYTMCYMFELAEIFGMEYNTELMKYTVFLVNYHMLGHQIEGVGRWKELFGDWYDDLMVFCQADKNGH